MRIKNIYRVHRILSTVIGVPIFLWAISGLIHPLMTSIRPKITTQARPENKLSPAVLRETVPLKTILQKAGIQQSFKIGLVYMDDSWYYQVLEAPENLPRYFSIQNGKELTGGDQKYAISLSRHFLNGNGSAVKAPVKSIQRITQYTDQYTYVNRLLPVTKVSFRRDDQIAVYVDTNNSDFAFALDRRRETFNRLFGWFHTWSWMNNLPAAKAWLIAAILLLSLFNAGLGIYLRVITRRGNNKKNPLIKARRLHRSTAIVGIFFMLAWGFSGLIHALQSSRPPFYMQPVSQEMISTSDLPDSLDAEISNLAQSTSLSAIRLMQFRGKLWVETQFYNQHGGSHDLMISQGVDGGQQSYYVWQKGNKATAGSMIRCSERQLAALMAANILQELHKKTVQSDTTGLKPKYLTHFTEQYNFSDKILPVWQINYGSQSSNNIFIDVAAGSLVKKADSFQQADAMIFAFLHKHEFMAWAGKSAKDASTIIGIVILLTLIIIGYRLLYVSWRHKQNTRNHT